jgi:hypothetical protein
MELLVRLQEALSLADHSPLQTALFLPPGVKWNLETPCALLEIDPYDDSEDSPPFAQEHRLRHTLRASQLQDILENAREQLANPAPEQLLAAFLFYWDRDAYIDFGTR